MPSESDNPWLGRRVIAFAHQGGAWEAPSSTLFAIRRALAAGATAIELDVHATLDGELVVSHDETVDRTTDGRGAIADLTLDNLGEPGDATVEVDGTGLKVGPTSTVIGATLLNAVFVEAEAAGRLMFYGAGAGGQPTASAVLGDIVAVARNRRAGLRGPEPAAYTGLPAIPMDSALTRYYVALDVADRPGVLAPVAESFARRGVSIKVVHQEGRGEEASLIIVTHTAPEAALAATVAELAAMDSVRDVDSVLRVEGEVGE